jgi:NhaP-type Na+/H+ and K+/H+ antiporter
MESAALTTVHNSLILLAIIFVTGMLSGKLAHYLRVPDVAIYMLAGILAGPVLHLVSLSPSSALNQFIMIFGAAVILFDGGRGTWGCNHRCGYCHSRFLVSGSAAHIRLAARSNNFINRSGNLDPCVSPGSHK